MQTNDAIILKKDRYLDPAAICEARHTGPEWMKDDDDYLKPFQTKKEKHHEDCGLHIDYEDMMGRHGCHICIISHPVSLISTISYNKPLLRSMPINRT